MSSAEPLAPWDMATLALRLLAIDPTLGGISFRARSSPVSQTLTQSFPANSIRLHPAMGDDVLFDGLDLSATLSTGKMVTKKGLLPDPNPLILAMAERCEAGLATRLGQTLDAGQGHTLILRDEGATDEERPPETLLERLAFAVDLNGVSQSDAHDVTPIELHSGSATLSDDQIAQIVSISMQLGVQSARATLFAMKTARAHAILQNRNKVNDTDIALACQMTLAHKATQLPETDASKEEPQQEKSENQSESNEQTLTLPDELLLEAVLASLPPHLLAQLQGNTRAGKGSGSGAKQKGNRRGRPLPARNGRMSDGARIDLIGTLRNAAPWQTIRKQQTGRDGVQIRTSDIRIKRFEDRSDRLLIFAVDASGSAALARLAEAKGAVELLLAEAYARRDHVALVAFQGEGAETLLPPTRSLVQTKRRLAELPGGGGTPLAAGMQAALEQALQARRKGMSPTVCILTDGRANIARDGSANRQQAATDAQDLARLFRMNDIDSLVIDTGNRPERKLKDLAATLDATYLPLPRANAERLSSAVSAALDT